MKILLEQESQHLVMSIWDDTDNKSFDSAIIDITEDLNNRKGVRRMSYDTWHWDLRRKAEAESYVTYFYLKHT
jgi:hypothetical protein